MALSPAAILICAYNEENWIGHTLRLMQGVDVNIPFVVVNDGSTDRTAQIAEENGANVINLSVNRGKANAFFAGLRWITKNGYHNVICLDADMLSFDQRAFDRMLRLTRSATVRKKSRMVVAGHREGKSPTIHFSASPIRAFSEAAMHRILHTPFKGQIKRHELDLVFLNYFFRPNEIRIIPKNTFHARAAYGSNQNGSFDPRKRHEQMHDQLTLERRIVDLLRRAGNKKPTQSVIASNERYTRWAARLARRAKRM